MAVGRGRGPDGVADRAVQGLRACGAVARGGLQPRKSPGGEGRGQEAVQAHGAVADCVVAHVRGPDVGLGGLEAPHDIGRHKNLTAVGLGLRGGGPERHNGRWGRKGRGKMKRTEGAGDWRPISGPPTASDLLLPLSNGLGGVWGVWKP